MVIFHATCRFSTMSLEFNHIYVYIYSIYTCRPNSKYSGNSLLKQGTYLHFAYSRSIHNMTYLRTWWYNTRNSKTDLADPSQTSSLLCFKGRIETHDSSGICHLAILPFDRVAFSNSMAAALQDVFFLRRLERTRGRNMFLVRAWACIHVGTIHWICLEKVGPNLRSLGFLKLLENRAKEPQPSCWP